MNFYKTTFTIMIIVLIICLAVIGTIISYSNNDVKFPPITSECPDYYKLNESGECVSQIDVIPRKQWWKRKGNKPDIPCDKVDFNNSYFKKKDNGGMGRASALCERKKWAKKCGVNWDGVTTNDNICYSTIN